MFAHFRPLRWLTFALAVLLTISSAHAADAFGTWLSTFGLPSDGTGLGSEDADPDFDGASNLTEYAYNTNPTSSLSRPPPSASLTLGRLQLSFPRDITKTDLTYHIEASTNLTLWTPIARSVNSGPTTNLGGSLTISETGVAPLTATVTDTATTATQPQRFLRLRLTRKIPRPAPALLWPNGIEPGDPSISEAPPGRRSWWIDAAAPAGGNGSYASPYNSFEVIEQSVRGGDFIYVRGTFDMATDTPTHQMHLNLYRPTASGTATAPTTVKSWRGSPRAIFSANRTDAQIRMSNNGGVRLQNLEITRFADQGIVVDDGVLFAEFINIVAHDGQVTATTGVGGGLVIHAQDSLHTFIVRNSLFYETAGPELGFNVGALSIITKPTAIAGSSVTVRDNILHDNYVAIRHKQAGPVHMDAYNNLLENNTFGFFLRTWTSDIHHNLLVKNKYALYLESDNMNANHDYLIRYNTFYDNDTLVVTAPDQGGFVSTLHIENNIFMDPTGGLGVLYLGALDWNWGTNNITSWTMKNNVFFFTPSTRKFIYSPPPTTAVGRNFADSMTQLGDTTSLYADPRFTNPAANDFTLQPNSPAIGIGTGNTDAGAF